MDTIRVILTSSGGLVSPGIIKSLKSVTERKVVVIGTDVNDGGIGKYFADDYYKVPSGDDKKYVTVMYELCKKLKINAVIPWSSEEFLSLAKNRKLFDEIGTKIISSDIGVLETAHDKGKFCNFLKNNNLPHPKFRVVNTLRDFEKCARELGYPEKKIVAKPTNIRGGNRGLRMLVAENDDAKRLLTDKVPGMNVTLEEMCKLLSAVEIFPEYILMEYLNGDEYSVDCLVDEGKLLAAIPKRRLVFSPGMSVVGEAVKDDKLIEASRRICEVLKCNYNVNLQFKYGDDGTPLPFEANPRIGATIAFCTATGANLLYYAIKMALGEQLPKINHVYGIKMLRYWEELYLDENGNSMKV